jgi:glutathione S-transferase
MIWLLEEIGAPYEIHPVEIFRPMTGEGTPDPANPHPDKRVPAIVHGDTLVAESISIVLYLCDAFPEARLAPPIGDVRRGAYLTWVGWYAAEMEPAMFAKMGGELDASPNKKRNYEAAVRRLESALERIPYVLGAQFSGADLLISSALAFGRQAFPPSATLDAYIERCRTRPAAERGLALDDAAGLQNAA